MCMSLGGHGESMYVIGGGKIWQKHGEVYALDQWEVTDGCVCLK